VAQNYDILLLNLSKVSYHPLGENSPNLVTLQSKQSPNHPTTENLPNLVTLITGYHKSGDVVRTAPEVGSALADSEQTVARTSEG
jgi:hypothetical protein